MIADDGELKAWIGRETLAQDVLTTGQVQGLLATTTSSESKPSPGSAAPLLSHWLSFLAYPPVDGLGPDGHPHRGGFLPPVALPRRMWAGGALEFVRPLRIGEPLERRSRIGDVQMKSGRSGDLVLVSIDHDISDRQGLVLRERQDLVYRAAPDPSVPAPEGAPAPCNEAWRRVFKGTSVVLFRYSALTFNAHRIHYDRPYATGVEGYPGLVVHGPLIATLLLQELCAQRPDLDVASFTFRALRPIFDDGDFDLCGSFGPDGAARLFARDHAGTLAMEASATLR